ncbi:hypothetical protein CGCVW01_v012242 [Colletotrichum viniferum]|nr:hypothetical protein CGCVW01_v012242 [Colletotrichum viniferum]
MPVKSAYEGLKRFLKGEREEVDIAKIRLARKPTWPTPPPSPRLPPPPQSVVVEAPCHDGRPCFAVWAYTDKDTRSPAGPDLSNIPLWVIRVYHTLPEAVYAYHVRDTAEKIYTLAHTRFDALDKAYLEHPKYRYRIEVIGLPLPEDTSDSERIERCMEHHRAEVAARRTTGSVFFIQTAVQGDYKHRIAIRRLDEDRLGEIYSGGNFLDVSFDPKAMVRPSDPEMSQYGSSRFATANVGRVFGTFRQSIRWFYDRYVDNGTIYRDTETWKLEAAKGK